MAPGIAPMAGSVPAQAPGPGFRRAASPSPRRRRISSPKDTPEQGKPGATPEAGPAAGKPAGQEAPPKQERPLISGATSDENRAEHQDYLRVLGQWGNLPETYMHYITVLGNMVVGGGRGSLAEEVYPPPARDSADVDPQEIEKIQRVYQRHKAYPEALVHLKKEYCVVLRGKLGVGKRAAAIRLGAELGGAGATIRELLAG